MEPRSACCSCGAEERVVLVEPFAVCPTGRIPGRLAAFSDSCDAIESDDDQRKSLSPSD